MGRSLENLVDQNTQTHQDQTADQQQDIDAVTLLGVRDPLFCALKQIGVTCGLAVHHAEIGTGGVAAEDAQHAENDQDGARPEKAVAELQRALPGKQQPCHYQQNTDHPGDQQRFQQ